MSIGSNSLIIVGSSSIIVMGILRGVREKLGVVISSELILGEMNEGIYILVSWGVVMIIKQNFGAC